MAGMRTIFMVVIANDGSRTGMSYNAPKNQRLKEALEVRLALAKMSEGATSFGGVEDYRIKDQYGDDLDPEILVCQVPRPGCVLAIPRKARARMGEELLSHDDSAAAIARENTGDLIALRENPEDKVVQRYARFIHGGAWFYDPTPITSMDVAVTYHEADAEAGDRLVELLTAKGLRCATRRVTERGVESAGPGRSASPAMDALALVVLISLKAQQNSWIAFDVGAAWVAAKPVVPVLIGEWNGNPPDIFAPYQRLSWEGHQERLVADVVDLLDLTPWSADPKDPEPVPVQESPKAPPAKRATRKRGGSGKARTRK